MKSAYIRVANVTHRWGAKELFEDSTIHVNGGEVLGIVGPNGVGKSTLLHILAGTTEPVLGSREQKGTLGIVTQGMDIQGEKTIGDILLDTQGKEDREALVALGKVGGNELQLDDKFHILSGGQRTKVRLAKCLIDEVDILLLDEPTNHLDAETITLLQGMIRRWHGPVILVSHDRCFLDAVCTHIVDIRHNTVETYTGNYSAYMQEREVRLQKQLQAYALQERKRKAMEQWLHTIRQRASVYTSPRRGKLLRSREKLYDRAFGNGIEKPKQEHTMQMSVGGKTHSQKKIVTIEAGGIGHRGNILYEIDTMQVVGEDRIHIQGANGSGKSTLLNFLLRAYDDKHLTQRVLRGENVCVGSMSQHDIQQYDDMTVMQRCSREFPQDWDQSTTITKLVSAGIPKEDMVKKMHQLSYGQRVKIRFLQLMSQSYECLILDEPTNHLDIDTRESLEAMLVQYQGTLIVVSHDQWFVDNIGINRIRKIEDGVMVEQ